MTIARKGFASLIVLVLLAGAASGQKVKLEYDKNTDFSRFKTYAWIEGTPARQKIWHLSILGAFDEELQAKGMKRVAPEEADVLFTYHVAVDTDLNTNELYIPSVAYRGGSAPLGYSDVYLPGLVGRWVRKGSMMVDAIDREHRQVVWRSMAAVTLKETNQKRVKQVNELIHKVMEKYPPPREKS